MAVKTPIHLSEELKEEDMGSFERLVRFRASDGDIYFAEAPDSSPLVGQTVKTYSKSPLEEEYLLSGDEKEIAEVLSPLPAVPIFYGIGLNYHQHAIEGGVSLWHLHPQSY